MVPASRMFGERRSANTDALLLATPSQCCNFGAEHKVGAAMAQGDHFPTLPSLKKPSVQKLERVHECADGRWHGSERRRHDEWRRAGGRIRTQRRESYYCTVGARGAARIFVLPENVPVASKADILVCAQCCNKMCCVQLARECASARALHSSLCSHA